MRRGVTLLTAALCATFALAGVANAQAGQKKPVHGTVRHKHETSATKTKRTSFGSLGSGAKSASAAGIFAPLVLFPPWIAGTTVTGSTLTARVGDWAYSPTKYLYQWRLCSATGTTCAAIKGATAKSYPVAPQNLGDSFELTVTATNSAGSTLANSRRTPPVQAPTLANTAPPVISGTAVVGDTLSSSQGSWSGSPSSYGYQWSDCDASGAGCTPIAGATASSYQVGYGDQYYTIEVTVTATNSHGSVGATSAPTAVVPDPPLPAPVNTSIPVISGTATVGNTLSAGNGAWSYSPTGYGYQWSDCAAGGGGCTSIAGATTATYPVSAGDVGEALEVTVTATNSGGSTSSTSAPTATVPAPPPPAPVISSIPTITGTAAVGNTLTASQGSWLNSPSSYAYQWEDCDSNGANCTGIGGAVSSSYAVASADENQTLVVKVTATNAGGSASASSVETSVVAVPPPPAPVNQAVPTVSGTPAVGSTLSASQGSWSNSPSSYAYQWQDCDSSGASCTSISGATSSSYKVASGDENQTLVVKVTATNAGGSASASSIHSSVVAVPPPPAPVNQAVPTISGTAAVGSTLTASNGSWSNSPAYYSFQWSDCDSSGVSCAAISGATSSTYPVVTGDEGSTLEVTVTAANAGGHASASSSATSVVPTPSPATPVNTSPPVTIGIAQVGDGLALSSPGSWTNSPTSYAYQWEDCDSGGANCSAISGQTYSTYVVASGDAGYTIRMRVTATNAAGSTAAWSSATAQVPGAPPQLPPVNSILPSISGTASVGSSLSASPGSWSNSPTSYAYRWSDCDSSGSSCSAISGATSSTYTVASGDSGATIEVAVTATNAYGSGGASSAPTAVVTAPAAPANTSLPTISGTAQVGNTLSASNGSWSGSPTSYHYQWSDCNSSGASCASVSGATASTYTLQASDAGHTMLATVTATNANGSTPASSHVTAVVSTSGGGSGGSSGSCTSPCTAKPSISGTALEGDTLTATAGSWNNNPGAFVYQWKDCDSNGANCVDVANGTNTTTYVVQPTDAGDTVVVAVTAIAAGGSATATSASTPQVSSGGPVSLGLPVVSGSVVAGSTLSASQGSWSGSGLGFGYQWSDCLVGGGVCVPVVGATGSSFVVRGADEGFAVEVTVTASNGSGSEAVSSVESSVVPVAPVSIDVSVSGLVVVGGVLTVRDHWSGSGLSYSYQWLDCAASGGSCSSIAGATSSSYTVGVGDESHSVEVRVSASNAGGSVSATSAASAVVQVPSGSGAPVSTGVPVVSGTVGEGDPLSASVGTWSGVPSGYAFQWEDCSGSGGSCGNVAGSGTSSVYVPTSRDVGDTLRVVVTASNGSGSGSGTSAATVVVLALGAVSNGGLSIVGDKLVDDAGAVVVPHGVDRSGSEYACWQFDSVSDGPIDAPATAAMATWNVNIVRVQLNEDCWLGIDGVPANVSGQNYINAIQAWVNTLHQYGMYAYISLMAGHPGNEPPDNNEPNAPDEDHSPLFWEQLASTFKNDPNVILAPQSELSSSAVDWNCYINGCSNEAASPGPNGYGPFDGAAPCYSPGTPYCGYYYRSAGMKQAVQIMRDAGYNGPIGIPCVNWANECAAYSGEGTLGGSWQSEVPGIDPNHQVMAEIHSYTNESLCASAACYNATLSPILSAGYPVIFGEFGENQDCAADPGGIESLTPWAQSNGVGWLSFAWDVYGFCTLISNYEPATPYPGGYAAYIQSLDQSLPG